MNTPVVRRPSGWWYPYIFVGIFMVVLPVNLVMAYFATSTFTGIETEHAYDKGLLYNQVLAKAKAQQALGWNVEATVLPHAGNAANVHDADVMVTYLDKDGHPVTGLTVKAEFVRPTMAGYDQEAELVEQGEGRYIALAKLPLSGQWDVRLTAQKADVNYEFGQRVLVVD